MALDLAHRLLAYRFNMSYVPVPIVPEFIDMLKTLYTKDEAWIAALMPPTFTSARTIAKLQRKDSAISLDKPDNRDHSGQVYRTWHGLSTD